MAVYVVIQDIEAEDKFLGPLTLKQFLFAGITAASGYLGFYLISTAVWYFAIPLIPVIILGAFLAFPWGRDQPTEVWLLAKIRFLFRPRRRVWDQAGAQELISITAPKGDNHQYVNNLDQDEIHSRLRILANTIDSRGWIIKNEAINSLYNSKINTQVSGTSDRLIDINSMPQDVPDNDITASDDIMDVEHSPLARQLDELMKNSYQSHVKIALDQMGEARTVPSTTQAIPTAPQQVLGMPAPNYWFINEANSPDSKLGVTNAAYMPTDSTDLPLVPEEEELIKKIKESPVLTKTMPEQSKASTLDAATNIANAKPMKPDVNPAILGLASNNDRDIASLSREANIIDRKSSGEVIINLH
ncbi:MAG: PrgI family protein [Candidatus Saccharibacteria bacterium]